MENDVLFIQGGGAGAYDEDSKLAESLKRELGAEYRVKFPRMPNEDDPEYEVWKPVIGKEIAGSQGKTILVAHSVGAYILLKYLTDEGASKPLPGIFIIAAPFPGGDNNWDFEGFSLPKNFVEKLPRGAKVFLYHSRDDDIVPFAHLALYAQEFPRAIARETVGGHQLGNDLSIVAEDIKRLRTSD